MATQNILLDSNIRDWVLAPLIIIMICVGMLRHYATILLKSRPTPNLTTAKDASVVTYSKILLTNGYNLPVDGFRQRVEKMTNPTNGSLRRKTENNPMQAMSDPSMMGDMMKNNMVMLLPNIGMMSLVSFFFSGFVIAKFPFALSNRFRGMVQRGVDIDNLDCCYVTSLSMYFLILFGLQGILQLVLGRNEGDETALMKKQMGGVGGGGGAPNQPVDYAKVFKQQIEELEFGVDHYKYTLQPAQSALLEMNPSTLM